MKKSIFYLLLTVMLTNNSCEGPSRQNKNTATAAGEQAGNFAHDLHFLSRYDDLVVLTGDNPDVRVIVSPRYQAKVFTSTAAGDSGRSFGWVNYKAFEGAVDPHMNAYGGENRFWLGPEGGKFSLFFKPGDKMVFEHWKTPAAVDTAAWTVTAKSSGDVHLQKEMALLNYRGTLLKLLAGRSIAVLGTKQVYKLLNLEPDASLKLVGYETNNTITNKNNFGWNDTTGMPCIWMLDMFTPSPGTVIIIPFRKETGKAFDDIVTSNYFGQIPPDRLKHGDEVLFFKADGRNRGKLGVKPASAMPFAGSYDAENRVLTITFFQTDQKGRYLNQEWNTDKPAYSGDAVNAYNDGPLANGSQMGPFYEIESVSPAAFLEPGESLSHRHSVFHFTGPEQALDHVSRKLLGVSLGDVKKIF